MRSSYETRFLGSHFASLSSSIFATVALKPTFSGTIDATQRERVGGRGNKTFLLKSNKVFWLETYLLCFSPWVVPIESGNWPTEGMHLVHHLTAHWGHDLAWHPAPLTLVLAILLLPYPTRGFWTVSAVQRWSRLLLGFVLVSGETSINGSMEDRLDHLLTSWKGIWNSVEWCGCSLIHPPWPADLQILPGKSRAGNFRQSSILKILHNVKGGEESAVSA